MNALLRGSDSVIQTHLLIDSHDGKDDICLVPNGLEGDRCDHDNHEIPQPISCLVLVSWCRKCLQDLPVVETAFAGARIFKGTISAGYSQVIPSQPTMMVLAYPLNSRAQTY